MSKWLMRGHFGHLHFKTFPMISRTPQCEVFWPLQSSSEFLGVLEDSKSPTLGVWVSSLHLGKVGLRHAQSLKRKNRDTKMRIDALIKKGLPLLKLWLYKLMILIITSNFAMLLTSIHSFSTNANLFHYKYSLESFDISKLACGISCYIEVLIYS
jgi:hypothetical protein